ncbi:uncharacterized protein [Palaemon carinicauda]|uniref:uncharacterized protein n=1 Tax=Palaemon carinicauda TaxID=392227 RepID=UPI0035B5A529
MDILTASVREEVPWSMMFADEVLVDLTIEEVERKLDMWRQALEDRGLSISSASIEYLWMGERKLGAVKMGVHNITQVNTFKYLGSSVMDNGDMESEINHKRQCVWLNWRSSGTSCDKRVSTKVKGRSYSVVRPALVYEAETWAIKISQERKLEVAEMRILW